MPWSSTSLFRASRCSMSFLHAVCRRSLPPAIRYGTSLFSAIWCSMNLFHAWCRRSLSPAIRCGTSLSRASWCSMSLFHAWCRRIRWCSMSLLRTRWCSMSLTHTECGRISHFAILRRTVSNPSFAACGAVHGSGTCRWKQFYHAVIAALPPHPPLGPLGLGLRGFSVVVVPAMAASGFCPRSRTACAVECARGGPGIMIPMLASELERPPTQGRHLDGRMLYLQALIWSNCCCPS